MIRTGRKGGRRDGDLGERKEDDRERDVDGIRGEREGARES